MLTSRFIHVLADTDFVKRNSRPFINFYLVFSCFSLKFSFCRGHEIKVVRLHCEHHISVAPMRQLHLRATDATFQTNSVWLFFKHRCNTIQSVKQQTGRQTLCVVSTFFFDACVSDLFFHQHWLCDWHISHSQFHTEPESDRIFSYLYCIASTCSKLAAEEGCMCVRVCVCYYGQQSSCRAMWVTTTPSCFATHSPFPRANRHRVTPPSWPMVWLPCLHAPGRQGPLLSIQVSRARERRGKKGGRQESEMRPLWDERADGCAQAAGSTRTDSGEQTHVGHMSSQVF